MKTIYFLRSVLLAAACSTSAFAQTSLFNLDNATITGVPNSVNSKYTYVKADPSGLYDVVVTVLAQTANSLIFGNPQVDALSGFTDGSTFSGASSYLTPSWNVNDGTTVGNFTATMSFQISVFRTGTAISAPLNLYATSFDNDGSTIGGNANVREQIIYGGSPSYLAVGSGETQSGNQFTATTTDNATGISTDPIYKIDALYNNSSSFTWTASLLVNDLAPDGGNTTRISALQLGFSPVPEPGFAVLSLLSFSILALKRRRC